MVISQGCSSYVWVIARNALKTYWSNVSRLIGNMAKMPEIERGIGNTKFFITYRNWCGINMDKKYINL